MTSPNVICPAINEDLDRKRSELVERAADMEGEIEREAAAKNSAAVW